MTVFQHTYIVVVVNKHFQAFKKELSSKEYMQTGAKTATAQSIYK